MPAKNHTFPKPLPVCTKENSSYSDGIVNTINLLLYFYKNEKEEKTERKSTTSIIGNQEENWWLVSLLPS